MQRTLIILKPDALQRGLIGNITTRFENKGLKIVAMKMTNLANETLREHYSHIAEKPFFPGIEKFMSCSPVILQIWEGKNAVEVVRNLCGVTNAREADIGTIRGDLAMSVQCNVVHASDSKTSAQEEINRFFRPEEIFEYDKTEYLYVYSEDEKN